MAYLAYERGKGVYWMTTKPTRTVRRVVTPKGWTARLKSLVNRASKRLLGKRLYTLSIHDLFGDPPAWQQAITGWWSSLVRDTHLPYGLVLFVVCLLTLIGWRRYFPDFLPDAWIEFIGLTYDVFFILLLFAVFDHRRQRAIDVRRQQEIIDDYKKWNSDEARFRIAGAVRRMIALGRADIDFGGIELREFSFRKNDIRNLGGSVFYDGTWGEGGSRDRVELVAVDFSQVNCREVVFSKFNPFSGVGVNLKFASFINCAFVGSDLEGAIFDGAHLEWTDAPPGEMGEWVEFDDAPPDFHQTYYPPFNEANLAGASFKDARFRNADFRQAEDVLSCNFLGANGLETCLFDDNEIKEAVLAMASASSHDQQETVA